MPQPDQKNATLRYIPQTEGAVAFRRPSPTATTRPFLPNPFDDRPARAKVKLAVIYAGLIGLNLAAWAWAAVAFSGHSFLLGTALLAYIFGLRHAFDADHIAAIDNVVRKLMQENKAPYSAGLFFSLGHSTVVFIASMAIVCIASEMKASFSWLRMVGGTLGIGISASFLLLIGIVNAWILRRIWIGLTRIRDRRATLDQVSDLAGSGGGVLVHIFRTLFRLVTCSWHMYFIGFIFGLGFDTATEVGVLGISAAEAAKPLPIWSILTFPALFAAGMSLMDATDSIMMTGAYGWAFFNPIRKLSYNFTMTAISVFVALFIGGIEAAGLLSDRLKLRGMPWNLIRQMNDHLGGVGIAIVCVLVACWGISLYVHRGSNRIMGAGK